MKHHYAFPPCASYDLEGTECWLEEMAQKGLRLRAEDPFFCGIAVFERSEPKETRYRLQAQTAQKGLFDDGFQEEEEEHTLCERYGWEYVGNRWQFSVYRTDDAQARELNTDPAIQSLTLRQVEKTARNQTWYWLLWLLLYPAATMRPGFFREWLHLGSLFFSLWLLVTIWILFRCWQRFRFLKRIRQQVQQTGSFRTGGWQQRGKRWRIGNFCCLGLVFVLVGLFLIRLSNGTLVFSDRRIPLSAVEETLPFPTLEGLLPEGITAVRTENDWLLSEGDGLAHWHDPLAQDIYSLQQTALLHLSDGRTFSGLLEVDDYHLSSPLLAKWLTWEIKNEPLRSYYTRKWYQQYPLPALPLEQAYAYHDSFPTVLLQDGNRVIRVMLVCFSETSEGLSLNVEQLAARLAEQVFDRT